MKRNYRLFIEDIIVSMSRIEQYLSDKSYQDFSSNQMVIDAVVCNLEIIGEAAKNIPETIRNAYPEIPWKRMIGLRNISIHAYFGIDHEILWNILTGNLPEVNLQIRRLLDTIDNSENNA